MAFWCLVALTHGVVGWSAMCDCGISDPTHLLSTYFLHTHPYFLIKIHQKSGIGVIRGVGVGVLCNS